MFGALIAVAVSAFCVLWGYALLSERSRTKPKTPNLPMTPKTQVLDWLAEAIPYWPAPGCAQSTYLGPFSEALHALPEWIVGWNWVSIDVPTTDNTVQTYVLQSKNGDELAGVHWLQRLQEHEYRKQHGS